MLPQKTGRASRESFSTTYDRVASQALTPGLAARLTARVRAGSLDRALIAGADPAGSPQLAARATSLTSARFRASIADGLERLMQVAEGPTHRWWAAARRGAVLANTRELAELAAELRGCSVLYARGVAILGELLSDGTGPAYRGETGELAHELHRARIALGGGETAGSPAGSTPQRAPAPRRASGRQRSAWQARARG
jgi:hypothetical protein